MFAYFCVMFVLWSWKSDMYSFQFLFTHETSKIDDIVAAQDDKVKWNVGLISGITSISQTDVKPSLQNIG